MPAPLRITLTPEEDRTLKELRLAQTVPQRTRDRAHILRLNAQGWNTPAISEMFECHQHDGNRISILGLWEPGESFEYALAQGGFNVTNILSRCK
jgi:hypothetical protein